MRMPAILAAALLVAAGCSSETGGPGSDVSLKQIVFDVKPAMH